ncbi:hypothetical protein A5625_00135 [Mycobacterium sp. 1465703.0]|nr:hypothetical protein A5625_00135 [Mycobacterium sp. 1465703.0]
MHSTEPTISAGHVGIAAIGHGWRNDPGIVRVLAVALVLRNHPWASRAAILVGFGSAALFVYAHVLPTFLPEFQDSFTSGPRPH